MGDLQMNTKYYLDLIGGLNYEEMIKIYKNSMN